MSQTGCSTGAQQLYGCLFKKNIVQAGDQKSGPQTDSVAAPQKNIGKHSIVCVWKYLTDLVDGIRPWSLSWRLLTVREGRRLGSLLLCFFPLRKMGAIASSILDKYSHRLPVSLAKRPSSLDGGFNIINVSIWPPPHPINSWHSQINSHIPKMENRPPSSDKPRSRHPNPQVYKILFQREWYSGHNPALTVECS